MNLMNISKSCGFLSGLILTLQVSPSPLALAQPAEAQRPTTTYKLIAPDLVAQGESFTGVVVEETERGNVPLSEGDRVVFQGQVVPVEEGGKIELPAFIKELGNTFVVSEIVRASGAGSQPSKPHHVEVVPAKPNAPTRIAQAPPIISASAPIRVTGQGLGALQKAALVGAEGEQLDLGKSFGSSLQQIYFAPRELPKGTFRLKAWDAQGNIYEAPNPCQNPTLRISGPPAVRRGQRVELTILSDTDGTVILSGGRPQIVFRESQVDVRANVPRRVRAAAEENGTYTVNGILVPPNDMPLSSDSPRVDSRAEPIQAEYNPRSNETTVTAPVRVVNERGQPAANVPMDVALSHPDGVEYGRVTTNSRGRVSFVQTIPGRVVVSALSAHVYRVLGHAWKQDPQPCCEILGIEIKVGGAAKGSEETEDFFDKLKDLLEEEGGETAEEIGSLGSKIINGYKFIVKLTRPWDIYAALGKGICKGEKCQVDKKNKVECRLIPRSASGKKVGMPGGVGGSENEAWPPRVGNQMDWWNEVGDKALARALTNILKYCECDDGKEIWPPPEKPEVPGCKQ